MDLKLPLKEYGLTDKEINVYLELLPLGTVNLQEVAKRVSYPRTTVYNTLNYLIGKGLVSLIMKGRVTYYTATDPQKFLDGLEEKKRLISSILPNLKEIKSSQKETSHVQIYEGFKGLMSILSDIFKIKQQTYYFGSYSKSLEILKHLPEHARTLRLERGIHAKIVIDPAEEESFHTSKYHKLTEVRFLPSLRDFPAMIFIYGNKVAMYTVQGDLIGVIIENKEFSLAMKTIFDLYWAQGKKARI